MHPLCLDLILLYQPFHHTQLKLVLSALGEGSNNQKCIAKSFAPFPSFLLTRFLRSPAQRPRSSRILSLEDAQQTVYDNRAHALHLGLTTIGYKIVETLYSNRVTSENKRNRTPPLYPTFNVGVFVVLVH